MSGRYSLGFEEFHGRIGGVFILTHSHFYLKRQRCFLDLCEKTPLPPAQGGQS